VNQSPAFLVNHLKPVPTAGLVSRAPLAVTQSGIHRHHFAMDNRGLIHAKTTAVRICGRLQETQQHVLYGCLPLMTAITARHNAILDRLIRALTSGTRFERKKCPVPNKGPLGLKPDLKVWLEDGHVVIADVCCMYENNETALMRAFDEMVVNTPTSLVRWSLRSRESARSLSAHS